MGDIYERDISADDPSNPVPVRILENEVDLYWHMALEMHTRIAANLAAGRRSVFILPVGPVWQYRRFIELVRRIPLDLSGLRLFFMDEYLADDGSLIESSHPLSFRGFIAAEFAGFLGTGGSGLRSEAIRFPDPADPASYDAQIADAGGADVCFAGVGINGHLAFNEAPCAPDSPSRIVELNPETVVTNSHTALGGAWERIPRRAVTVGMKSILSSRRLSIWMNRPWQRSVVRKLLFGPVSPAFPASFARNHPDAALTLTADVAERPRFGLR